MTAALLPNELNARPLRVLALSLYGPLAASHRVRLSQFVPGLAEVGIQLQIQSLLDDHYLAERFNGRRLPSVGIVKAFAERLHILRSIDRYDLALVYGELFPFLPHLLERSCLRLPFIYDFDDAFFLKYRGGRYRFLNFILGGKFDRMIASAAAVSAGNTGLLSYAARFNANVTLLPSVVDTDVFRPLALTHLRDPLLPFRVGWIGSPSTAPYLQLLVEPLQRLARERPVCLVVIGGPAPALRDVEVIELPWRLADEVTMIQQFDVGVMPLPDTPWTRGKCAYKLVQCMACGIPVVASAVGANRVVVPPTCGILASSPEDWLHALRLLADDVDHRHRLGRAGRRWVRQNYSLDTALPILSGLIQRVARSLPHHRRTAPF